MSRKLLAILAALLVAASLCACNNNEEEPTDNGKINVNDETDTKADETDDESDEIGSEIGTGSTEIGDPGEYSYTECNEVVYINNPASAVTLRSETYEDKGSVPHGTQLTRIGLSKDEANYWSKVKYNDEEYYVASKFLTTIDANNPDEGFVEGEKTVVVNDKTGSLNIRNVPSMESTVIGHAIAGADIKVIAENTETGWYKVEFVDATGETSVGYIASNPEYFVKPETEATTETETDAVGESDTETTTEASTESAGK